MKDMVSDKGYTYPLDGWNIIEEEFDVKNNYINETIFALGNGYIGMRGNFEEGFLGPKDSSLEGIYLNGFYESEPIHYGEGAYGYAKNNQTMLNVTNSRIIKIYVGNEEFNMLQGKTLKYKRTLNMKEGVLTREVLWRSHSGKELQIVFKRITCFENKNLAVVDCEITPVNFSGSIKIVSALDGCVKNVENEGDPRVGSAFQGQVLKLIKKYEKDGLGALLQRTTNTGFTLLCGMKNKLDTRCSFTRETREPDQKVEVIFNIEGKCGEKIELTKYIAYFTSRDYEEAELLDRARETLELAEKQGLLKLAEKQREYLYEFWQDADITIEGDEALQQGIRFNEFHLLESVGRDGRTNIAAKGVTGEGYEGHYFWDTEIFTLPFFLYTKPEISRKLLEYRYNILNSARLRAKEMGQNKGALYPWRTINGEECSAYYPAGTAQYHINADIIYAVKHYVEAAEDMDFLLKYGAEMVFETARTWLEIGCYNPFKQNKFCINCVTGPDEYTAIVDNNCYTNYMAKMNLMYACEVSKLLKENYEEEYVRIKNKIGLLENEVDEWHKAAENMYLPYDENLKIHPQDDSFLEKKVWDFKNTPPHKYPLLLHYHPLVIYRHQVCKQADVVLAEFLLGNEFTSEDKKRDYDYYEPITTHDSSLSTCIYSVIASEIGYRDKAYKYFMKTARMDLDNYQGNSQHGVHTACMAGAWMCMINGFAGARVSNGALNFNPYLPEKWNSYSFTFCFKNCRLNVKIEKEKASYALLMGERLEFYHNNEKLQLKIGDKVEMPIEIIDYINV